MKQKNICWMAWINDEDELEIRPWTPQAPSLNILVEAKENEEEAVRKILAVLNQMTSIGFSGGIYLKFQQAVERVKSEIGE